MTNITNKGIIIITDEGKDIERRNVSVKGGDITGKRNNKERGTPLINYNG